MHATTINKSLQHAFACACTHSIIHAHACSAPMHVCMHICVYACMHACCMTYISIHISLVIWINTYWPSCIITCSCNHLHLHRRMHTTHEHCECSEFMWFWLILWTFLKHCEKKIRSERNLTWAQWDRLSQALAIPGPTIRGPLTHVRPQRASDIFKLQRFGLATAHKNSPVRFVGHWWDSYYDMDSSHLPSLTIPYLRVIAATTVLLEPWTAFPFQRLVHHVKPLDGRRCLASRSFRVNGAVSLRSREKCHSWDTAVASLPHHRFHSDPQKIFA